MGQGCETSRHEDDAGHSPSMTKSTDLSNLVISEVNQFLTLTARLAAKIAVFQDSWLHHASSGTSFCSGCGTAEMSRAVLERDINQSGKLPFHVSVPCVGLWASLL